MMNRNDEAEKKEYAPVALFVYDRADKARNCISSLIKNKECIYTDFFIFSDGPKSENSQKAVNDVRNYLDEIDNYLFRSVKIVKSSVNKGLANSIIDGVTNVLDSYEKVIVLEDDLVVSPFFLEYMNKALDFYQDNKKVGAISGYTYPLRSLSNCKNDVYALRKGDCWGWATWKERWNNASWQVFPRKKYVNNIRIRNQFEKLEAGWDAIMIAYFKGDNSSWAIRWVYYLMKSKYYTIYPTRSYVSNEGCDGSGTHCIKEKRYSYDLDDININEDILFIDEINEDKKLAREASVYTRSFFPIYLLYRIKIVLESWYIFNIKKRFNDTDFSKV